MNSENTITTTAAIDNDSQQTAAVAVAALSFDQTKGLQQQLLWTPQDNNNYSDVNTPKVPRPPNAFIIYHRTKSKELARYKSSIRSNSSSSSNNSNNGHPSKTVAEMWREETDAVKLRYQREADLALVEHKKKYPFYKYRPRKRENKNKLKTRGCGGAGNNNKCVNNNNAILSPTDSEFGIVNKDDDHHDGSEVPPEHRKQASMESAFTAIKKNTFSPPQTPKTPNFLNPSEHHPLSLITMASKMPQTAIISSLLHQQLYHSPIEDLHHQQFSLQMSRADNSIDLDNGQSSLVINQPDHLQQQLMFTQDEFQQFPSELSQDDWNSQLFNYINGSNANNDEDANSSDNYDMQPDILEYFYNND
ncbi:7121_t:CDS:2 [Entrophospora sp. SA101]|nr:7121_t:CDS:2 [Entrophospora sp. SA101]